MKKFYLTIVAFCTILLCACSSKTQQLSKLWFFTHTSGVESPRDIQLNPICFLNLESSGKYTSYLAVFDYGNWTYKNDIIYLKSDQHYTTELPLKLMNGDELEVKVNNSSANYFFDGYNDHFDSELDNPFSIDNNKWRIKPAHSETDEQITYRLKNHLQFWEKYFAWALNTEKQSVDARSTPSPIKIYGNGFTLKRYDDLPDEWKNCFYDSTDGRKASEHIQNFFSKTDIAWPHTDNKFKMFLSAFQQLNTKFK